MGSDLKTIHFYQGELSILVDVSDRNVGVDFGIRNIQESLWTSGEQLSILTDNSVFSEPMGASTDSFSKTISPLAV